MPDSASLYDKDWYAWTQDQAARLRELPAASRPNGLDVENLAEEVESMGASQRRAIRSLLEQLYIHLLKMAFHPASNALLHWQAKVDGFRIQIEGKSRIVRCCVPACRSSRPRHGFARRAMSGADLARKRQLCLSG